MNAEGYPLRSTKANGHGPSIILHPHSGRQIICLYYSIKLLSELLTLLFYDLPQVHGYRLQGLHIPRQR